MANANDARVVALRAEIESKRDALKSKTSRFSPITNCSVELYGVRYNIHALDKPGLILLGSQLQALNMAAEALVFDLKDLVISGFAAKDWITDVLAKIESLTVREEELKLVALDTKLKKLLSEDAKTDLELKEIEALLA